MWVTEYRTSFDATHALFCKQVWPVAPRLLQRSFPAPATNVLVVAAHQHFRNVPSAKRLRPRIVRTIQDSATGIRSKKFCGSPVYRRQFSRPLIGGFSP